MNVSELLNRPSIYQICDTLKEAVTELEVALAEGRANNWRGTTIHRLDKAWGDVKKCVAGELFDATVPFAYPNVERDGPIAASS